MIPSSEEFESVYESIPKSENDSLSQDENDDIKSLLLKSQICDLRVLQLTKGLKELNLKEKLDKKILGK